MFMGVGLTLSHLTAAGFVARFLYPVKEDRKQQLFVGLREEMPPGSARAFRTPTGQTINIVHGTEGFIALSDVCPHLGCKVLWESVHKEFLCPCHQGRFDTGGKPLSGPPAEASTPLSRFEVKTDSTSVYIVLPVRS